MLPVALAACLVGSLVGCTGNDSSDGGGSSESTIVVDGQTAVLVTATVPEPTAPDVDADRLAAIEESLASGGVYAKGHLGEADPASLVFFDYLSRNWAVPGLSEARTLAEAMPLPTEGEAAQLSRLIDPDAPVPAIPTGEDANPMVAALNCDKVPLASDFASRLADQVRQGDAYNLSHAAYSIVWLGERGCKAPDLTPITTGLVERLQAELAKVMEAGSVVEHDSLLLSVGLIYLGRGDLVPPEWFDAVIDAQRLDGGWEEVAGDDQSSWHTTGVALWTLAGGSGPGEGVPFIVAG